MSVHLPLGVSELKNAEVSRPGNPALESAVPKLAQALLLGIVDFYVAVLSPFLGGACKFYPSCSQYAREAIRRHGARTGGWLALKRLSRCRPFTEGGYDPVPDEEEIARIEALTRQKELMKWTR
jgi:uncharacterized protein